VVAPLQQASEVVANPLRTGDGDIQLGTARAPTRPVDKNVARAPLDDRY
jgi:hypothetical protein